MMLIFVIYNRYISMYLCIHIRTYYIFSEYFNYLQIGFLEYNKIRLSIFCQKRILCEIPHSSLVKYLLAKSKYETTLSGQCRINIVLRLQVIY